MDKKNDKISSLGKYSSKFDRSKFKILHEEMSYAEYIDILHQKPTLVRTAFQYLWDAVQSYGTVPLERYRKTYTKYNFFDDPSIPDPVFGLEETLDALMNFLKGAAGRYGTEHRFLLLHGPVGSSKSTICRRFKRGLEHYSQTDAGAWYSYKWINLPSDMYTSTEDPCPMHEDPVRLMSQDMRNELFLELNHIHTDKSESQKVYDLFSEGSLCPRCQDFMDLLLAKYEGDWEKVVNEHIVVCRQTHSEGRRMGIGTFQPKDEKNQDATELTGDINFAKIGHFGKDSDSRCVEVSTLISTKSGFLPIGEFVHDNMEEEEFYPIDEEVHTLGGSRKAFKVFNSKIEDCVQFYTKMGYSITCTRDHKLFVIDSTGTPTWKKSETIGLGDYVALHAGTSTWGEDVIFPDWEYKKYGNERINFIPPKNMTPDLGLWIGLWLGGGHMTKTELGWTQMEADRRQVFSKLTLDLFNVNLHEIKKKEEVRGLRVDCTQMLTWLKLVLGLKAGAGTKTIPESILRSSKETIKSCIRGLFETDDNFHCGHATNTASFVSMSETMTRQLQQLLLAIGVMSSVKKTKNWYTLLISGRHVNYLCEQIPEFKDRFTKGSLKEVNDKTSCVDGIPYARNLMVAVYKDCQDKQQINKYYGNIFDKNKLLVNRDTIKCFLNDVAISNETTSIEYKLLSSIIEMPVYWLAVTSKKEVGPKRVADISVNDVHNYWADGFVSHNCFSFDGEFCQANRGIFELIEVLKLHQEFLYDLLGASQEHNIKPKKFPQIFIDEVIIGHTNAAEFQKLKSNEFMEALRDRTNKIDVPYLLRVSDELKIYTEAYGVSKVHQHIMPHTLEIAAIFAVLTRLHDDDDQKLDLRDKAKLYDGQSLPNWTEDSVKELRDKNTEEGLSGGISARFIQDSISNCLARNPRYINVFHVLNEIKEKIQTSVSFNVDEKKRYEERLDLAIKELQDILKNEVQRALVSDENLIVRVCAKYIDNVVAFVNKERIVNPITKKEEKPDERLMRSIEEKIDIPEQGADDYRRSLAAFIGTMAAKKKEFRWDSNPELKRALEAKLFEDVKDTIKLSTLTAEAAACDPELQERIDAIKTRLIKQYGYNLDSATDVLSYVSSLFAAGTK